MYYQNCTVSLGSQTRAIKAQHILTRASVSCRVVSTTSTDGRRGCGYGVEFPCGMRLQVEEILRQNKISIRDFHGGDSTL